jgi:hypothetical protein
MGCVGLAMIFLPEVSAAGIPTNFATLPQGSWVQGTAHCGCHAVNGNFVRPADLALSQQNIEQALLAVGKALNTGQMQQMEAQKRLENQALQEKAQFQKELAAYENANRTKMQVTNQLTTSIGNQTVSVDQPGSRCNEMAMAQNLGSGMVVNRRLASDFGAVLSGYDQSDVSAMSSLKALANAKTSTLSAASIFPTATASSAYPSPSDAAKTIAHLTEPVPPVQLTAKQKKTQAGVLWSAAENAIQAKMSMAQNALATIAAWHQPTIDATYFINKWKSMQKAAQSATGTSSDKTSTSANPPGVNSAGKISPDGALNLMVQARYANPSWYSHLAVQSQSGAIKDLTEMEAISLRVHWEALRMSEYLAALSADQYAHEVVTPTNNTLTGLNANAMAQDNGAFHGK